VLSKQGLAPFLQDDVLKGVAYLVGKQPKLFHIQRLHILKWISQWLKSFLILEPYNRAKENQNQEVGH
jgi:hypothetical protein